MARAIDSKLRAFMIPLTVAVGGFLWGLDQHIVVTSLPQIALSLHETPLRLTLVVTSYLMSLAVFIPVSGWMADRFGCRIIYCAAILIFTGSSVWCGFAHSLTTLVIARIAQGFGGALMNPVGQLVILRSFPRDRMLVINNTIAIASLIGPVSGPLVGGFITTYYSWPWIFFINVPIGVFGVISAWCMFDDDRTTVPSKFDLRGFVLAGLGIALLQCGVDALSIGVSVPVTALFFLLSACAIVSYVFHARTTDSPVLDLRLLKVRTFRATLTWGGIATAALSSTIFLTPLYLQLGFGMTSMQSGARTFVGTFGNMLVRFGVPTILKSFGFRRTLVFNSCLLAAVTIGFGVFQATTPIWFIGIYFLVFGMVRSIQWSCLGNLAYSDVPPASMSRFTALSSVTTQMWSTCGVGIAAGLLSALTGADGRTTPWDFRIVFATESVIMLVALAGFWRLRPNDGAEVSGHRTPATAKAST